MPHDVFISYSHEDKSATDAICSILEQNNIRCWIAPRDITPGAPFAEAIIDGIREAKIFILVYSSNSNQSHQVIKEVDRAVNHGLAIIPFRLEDVPMSKQLEYYVSDVHWLDASTPPLEQHIGKLRDVVQILLAMDEVDSADIEEAFSAATVKQGKAGIGVRRFGKLKFLVPAVFALLISVFSAVRYFDRQSEIRWAREVALPEIGKLIGENDAWRNLVAPYRLAERTEVILGDDPELAALFSRVALNIDVLTEPPGANVYMKEYVDTASEWTFLGVTPLKKIRVPIGIFRWKMEKEGYAEVLAAESTWSVETTERIVVPNVITRTLDPIGKIPPGMVRVPKTETPAGTLGDFFVGRFEVTNGEYKAFVDAGGYQNRRYWQHPFVEDGREITWEEATSKFIDQSGQPGPALWLAGDYPQGQGDHPVSGVNWYEAAAYAEYTGMSLLTSTHWDVASGGMTPMIQVYQLGGFAILAPFSNFGGQGPVAVGSLSGITAYGANDMAGNVREWCWNESPDGRVVRGGSWLDNTYDFVDARQAPAMDRSPRNGIRLAFYPDPDAIPAQAFEPGQLPETIDVYAQKPVADDIFNIYREQFAYDPMELNSRVETREQSPGGWIHETVSYDAAYGGERVLAHLFLPENVSPPYQAVIYFPGSASTWVPSSQAMENYYEFTMFLSYLVRNGRAVLYPVYKGTFERGEPALTAIHGGDDSYAYTEFLIQTVKDIRRSVDYLETREDIDSSKLAFYGMSWGGIMGTIVPAVEARFRTSILVAGGLFVSNARPEANAINYVRHVEIPTLMLNGMYDTEIDRLIKPGFNLLGTPPGDKRLILYETDHIPPRAEYIKETLQWLDKYLGPVK
jgi:dienelactone hydrolase